MASDQPENGALTPLGEIIMRRAYELVAHGHVLPDDRPARNRRRTDLTQREIWTRAKVYSGGPARETLNGWINGKKGPPSPDPRALQALARALASDDQPWRPLYDEMLASVEATPRGGQSITLDVTGCTREEIRSLFTLAALFRIAHGETVTTDQLPDEFPDDEVAAKRDAQT